MKKFIGIALVLALAVMLMPAAVFAADPAVEVTIIDVVAPDVTVTAYKAGPGGNWSHSGTAQFTLTGTGTAVGSVTASLGGSHWSWGPCPGQPTVFGGYTATNGNIQSQFSADTYQIEDTAYFSSAHWSTQGVNATGLPDVPITIDPGTGAVSGGSMTVTGHATAVCGGGSSLGGFTESAQSFDGEAASATVSGSKMWSNRQGLDRSAWDPAKYEGANFTATATGSSTVTFVGSTEGGVYPQGGETSPCRVLTKQGLGFDIDVGSSVGGELWTRSDGIRTGYEYTKMVALDAAGNELSTTLKYDAGLAVIKAFNADRIVGESSTPITDFSGGGYGEWQGIPGYILP